MKFVSKVAGDFSLFRFLHRAKCYVFAYVRKRKTIKDIFCFQSETFLGSNAHLIAGRVRSFLGSQDSRSSKLAITFCDSLGQKLYDSLFSVFPQVPIAVEWVSHGLI